MIALPLPTIWSFLNVLIPLRSPIIILNVMADIGLLLLVPGCRAYILRLPPGPESSLVPLLPLVQLPFVQLPFRLLFRSTPNP